MEITEYRTTIPSEVFQEIKELVNNSGIDEEFDYKADLIYTGRLKDKLVVVNAFRLGTFENGTILPRFIHVIFHPDIQKKGKAGVLFLLKVQKILSETYEQMYAYILNSEKRMFDYAIKFGFDEWYSNKDGKYLFKNIRK